MKEGTTMTDFWRDLVLTAMHNMSVTLGTVLPSILAMLTLVVLGALLGWIAGTIVSRLALALGLDQRSRTWGITSALARAGIYRPPSQVLRLVAFWGIFVIFATMGIDALFGGLVLALALAFGLGGRHLAREILERGRRRDREPVRQDSITHL